MTSKTDIPSSSSSPPFRKLTYDVFLSFCGEDTRYNFTDHLYTALKRKEIVTYRDNEELPQGESIGPNLLKAIEESRYVVVIFSKNYANSSWCLDEVAKVADCMKAKQQKVFPVFYHVDPSEVRKQTGHYFGKAFEKHQERFEEDKVQRWKDALYQVGNLRGLHIKDGSESEHIQEIVQLIFTKLNELISTSAEGLVGMDSRLEEVLSDLDVGCHDVRILGIWGMGGIGKTTIAEVVYDRIRSQFEGSCFLKDCREETEKKGVVHLQEKLLSTLLQPGINVENTTMGKGMISHRLSTKKVLIVLDDVDKAVQLEALCHHTWFGPGSRIIITSRDEHLFSLAQADKVYEVNPLSNIEALQLFSLKASKGDRLVGDFVELSEGFLKYAHGLPLAIKVLGSSVYGRTEGQWSSALDRLKKNPEKEILGVLKWSFDGLEESEQRIFLDIACFFKGKSLDRVRRILQGNNAHCPDIDIQVLLDKSMITISGKKLWMHDMMQELGWAIVCQENIEPGRRSRLWRSNEIIRIINRSKATSRVQSISLLGPKNDDVVYSLNDSFSEMDNLRLLRIKDVKFSGNIEYLSNELQYLQWHECPLGSFPSDFQADNLVELKLHSSCIQHLWRWENGWSMLRFIDLRGSKFLRSTPDFTKVPNLEKLNLHDCTSLVNIHPSLGCLNKLKVLDMTNCESVESLPPFCNLESLGYLSLAYCSRLKRFMEIEGDMKALLYLFLAGTSIEELPTSVARLTGLKILQLDSCKKLLRLPSAIRCLESLETLSLSRCANINELPDGMKNLKSLSCCGCKGLASESGKGLRSLWSLTGLIVLELSDCSLTDGAIPNDLSSLVSLTSFNLSGNNFVRLPDSISQLSKLNDLCLSNCTQLQLVPKLPSSVGFVYARGCNSLTDYPNHFEQFERHDGGLTVLDSRNSSLVETTRFHTPSDPAQFMRHLVKTVELVDNLPNEVLEVLFLHFFQRGSRTEYRSEITYGDEIPEWFSFKSEGNSVSIPIPPKLHRDDKWHGVAVCALFSENRSNKSVISSVHPGSQISKLWFLCCLTMGHDRMMLQQVGNDEELWRPFSHLLPVFYIPKVELLSELHMSDTLMFAGFASSHPSLWEVQICGIRLVYEQDVGWYDKLFPQIKSVCLNDVEDAIMNSGWISRVDTFLKWEPYTLPVEVEDAIQNSGWISRVDTFLKWEPYTLPVEEDSNTILQRKNLQSVLPRFLEAKNSASHFMFNLSGFPGWCMNTHHMTSHHMTYPPYESYILPQNLHKCNEWMGLVVYASIVAEEDCSVYLQLTIGEYHMNLFEKCVRSSKEPHQLLFIYIPRAEIIQEFSQASQTDLDMVLIIDSPEGPQGEVQMRGFDIVNRQEGLEEFVETIIHCMQRADDLKFHENTVVASWIELLRLKGDSCTPTKCYTRARWERKFELLSKKYRKWDWSASGFHCYFLGDELRRKKWLMHFNEGNSAEIQLPSNLLGDPNWLGIAVCGATYWRTHEDQNIILDTPDSDTILLRWLLEFDVAGARLCTLGIKDSLRKPEPGNVLADSTHFRYVPRTNLKLRRQCNSAKAIYWSSSPCLGVRSCALRLVYKDDIEDLVQSLTLCELP